MNSTSSGFEQPDKKTIQVFFNSISPLYDLFNSLLTFGIEKQWRRKLVSSLPQQNFQAVLDVGTGTGKSLAAFLNAHRGKFAVGCDFSVSMLEIARSQVDAARLAACDFHHLTFKSSSFDLVTGSFILRSVQDLTLFFKEIYRVTQPQGKVAFLELTRPKSSFFWNFFYKPYLRFYIPFIGKLLSKNPKAYLFLSESIQSFKEPTDLRDILESTGFRNISIEPLSLGIVTIIQGEK